MKSNENLAQWITEIANLIEDDIDPEPHYFTLFVQEPELSLRLVDLIESLDEQAVEDENRSYYSACIFALEICVAQLQSTIETNNKSAFRVLNQLMEHLADTLNKSSHNLSFWLPILNAFYEVHVDLLPDLQDAYYNLVNEQDFEQIENTDHINAIREMITELAHLSTFDIAENFFAQSYAMPPDFFSDLIVDLYNIEEGKEIAILALLHPKQEVREMAVSTINELIEYVTLSPVSLSRLQAIKRWYPATYEEYFNQWLKKQRLKGVFYHLEKQFPSLISIKASEVDGSGAQGIFIHIRHERKNRLCGLLFKHDVGIKDAWVTPSLSGTQVKKYYKDAFDESVTLRTVDMAYLQIITEHFLALTIEHGAIPELHLLEIQELLGLYFTPKRLNIAEVINDLSIQISPFTPDVVQESFKRSKSWLYTKPFTESWYIENSNIDKLVNRFSSFVDGTKVCGTEEAINSVFSQEMEVHREKWLFHFLWITLWLKSKTRKNEKIWQDSFFIAHAIYTGMPLHDIPVMQEIVRQTVFNSIETMNDRGTYLHRE